MLTVPYITSPVNNISKQGVVPNGGGNIYAPPTGYMATVTGIRINCTTNGAYSVAVLRGTKTPSQKVLLYRLFLNWGDIVNDDTEYQLSDGDFLYLQTENQNVYYSILGIEYKSL
jgi:hypothetical protein